MANAGWEKLSRFPDQLRFAAPALALFLFSFFLRSAGVFAQSREQPPIPDALAEYNAGNYQTAVSICLAELEANAANIDSHVVLGWSLIKLGRYEDAIKYAREGRRFSYYDARLIEILGEASYFQGQNTEALAFFEEYINTAPDGARIDLVYYFLGEIFIRMGRFRHADISFSTALHYVPLNAAWWTRLGYARERSGDLTEAVKAYERAISLDAQFADARRGLERARANLAR